MVLVFGLGFPGRALAFNLADKEPRVFDYAGLFNEKQKRELEAKAQDLRKEMKVEVVVMTSNSDLEGQQVADYFYFENDFHKNFHENGVVILIRLNGANPRDREVYLGTYGSMIRILTDRAIASITDEMVTYAAAGGYQAAIDAAMDGVKRYYDQGIVSGQYNYDTETGRISRYRSIAWYEALFAISVSGFAAIISCMGVRRKYKMQDQASASYGFAYRANSRFALQEPADALINSYVTHTVIPRTPPPSGDRGGGFGGGGGGGRSSTHTYTGSRGGRHTAGGGGRKF